MSKTKYLGNKPYVGIGTIGCKDYGKTTLTAAINKYCSLNGGGVYKSYKQINNSSEQRFKSISISASYVEYETLNRYYLHCDCPEYSDYVKGIISGIIKMDIVILVISAGEIVISQIEDYISLMKQTGISNIIVFVNKCDMVVHQELLGLVEVEVRDILNKNGFCGDNIPIIYGSALKALESESENILDIEYKCIADLLKVMDKIVTPIKDKYKPFLMSIEDIFNIRGRGLVVTGKIERGFIRVGEKVELLGISDTSNEIEVTGIEMFRKNLSFAEVGDNVGILLKDIERENITKGQVIAEPGSIKAYNEFEAEVYVLTKKEYGRSSPFFQGYRPQIYFKTVNTNSTIELPKDKKVVMLGDRITMKITLDTLIALEKGLRFSICEFERIVGFGIVSNLIR